jgi:transcriptional regulator with XRE-family HTH domain
MPRQSRFSNNLVQELRRYFGLPQRELASYLGVSEAFVGHLEAGRKAITHRIMEALMSLTRHLPAEGAGAIMPGAWPALPADPAPLLARLDYCQHHARRLRRLLRSFETQAAVAARWAAALPTLRAALPPDPGPAAEPDPATSWLAWLAWYRHRWLDQRPTALTPDQSARYHLLRLQAEALETETAALRELLGEA